MDQAYWLLRPLWTQTVARSKEGSEQGRHQRSARQAHIIATALNLDQLDLVRHVPTRAEEPDHSWPSI